MKSQGQAAPVSAALECTGGPAPRVGLQLNPAIWVVPGVGVLQMSGFAVCSSYTDSDIAAASARQDETVCVRVRVSLVRVTATN